MIYNYFTTVQSKAVIGSLSRLHCYCYSIFSLASSKFINCISGAGEKATRSNTKRVLRGNLPIDLTSPIEIQC